MRFAKTRSLLLGFPQWQGQGGSSAPGIARGAALAFEAMQAALPSAVPAAVVRVRPPPAAVLPPGVHLAAAGATGFQEVNHHQALAEAASAAAGLLREAVPAQLFTAGGDCSVSCRLVRGALRLTLFLPHRSTCCRSVTSFPSTATTSASHTSTRTPT